MKQLRLARKVQNKRRKKEVSTEELGAGSTLETE